MKDECESCGSDLKKKGFRKISIEEHIVHPQTRNFTSIVHVYAPKEYTICRDVDCWTLLMAVLDRDINKVEVSEITAVGPTAPGSPGCCNDINR